MANNLPDELLNLFAAGALEKNEIDELITLLHSENRPPLDKIGNYQFLMSLIPTTMKLESPDPMVKEEVAKKLLSFQDEILKKIKAKQSGEKEDSIEAATPISAGNADNKEDLSISDGLVEKDPAVVEVSDISSEVENLPADDSSDDVEADKLSDDFDEETEEIAEELQTDEIKDFLDNEFSADGFNVEKYDETDNAPIDQLKIENETFSEPPDEVVEEEFVIPDDISLTNESDFSENEILSDNSELIDNNSLEKNSDSTENEILSDNSDLGDNNSLEKNSDPAENEILIEPIDFEKEIIDEFEINKKFDADIGSQLDDLPLEPSLAEDEDIFKEEQKFDFSADLDKQFFKEQEFEQPHNIVSEPEQIEIMESNSSKLSWILPGSLLAALLILGFFFITTTNSLRDDIDRLEVELSGLNSEVSNTRQYITNNAPLVEFFKYNDLIITNLDGKSRFPEATGKLLLSFGASEGLLQLNNLPQLEGKTSYQLWLQSGSKYYSMGTFQPDRNKLYFKINDLPLKDKNRITSFKVTEEPVNGSKSPKGLLVIDGFPERKPQSQKELQIISNCR